MEKREHTKSCLVSIATKLFQEKGFQNVTIKDICESAGITRATFYKYFDSKDAVLDSLFTEVDSLSLGELSPIFEQESHVDQLYYLIGLYLDLEQEGGQEITSLMMRRMLERKNALFAPENTEQRHIYRLLIEKAQQAGEIENQTPPDILVDTLICLWSGLLFTWCSTAKKLDMHELVKKHCDALLMVKKKNENGT